MIDYTKARLMMVDTQVRPSDVTKFPIIDALLSVKREVFVPSSKMAIAYAGENLDLGDGRELLDPRSFAKMLDALDVQPDELVLDLGCGLGYSSAVLARMAEAVVAVEENPEMASEAEELLGQQGVDNVAVHEGALSEGAAKHGPYDVIVIQGAIATLPDAIASQLKEGGRIAALFKDGAIGECRIGYKRNGNIAWRMAFHAGAELLAGFEQEQAFAL